MMVSRYRSVVTSTGSSANVSTDGLDEPKMAAKSTSSSSTSAPHAVNQAKRTAMPLAEELPTSGGSNTERRGADETTCSSSSLSLSLAARMIIAHVEQILPSDANRRPCIHNVYLMFEGV
ncbi:hypothetical protein PF005_g16434 [Phytophthora fragariae]|uniref:Uncharacterized protein n=2 Tax=Phytophthora fragariae TaxID=53985 RepID=A0A6A3X7E4_9STRA|nr:hypothetical protein PF005_g16434 [Phytophthora fragariae]KAE9307439.1 hypothetical protein PF001_g11613 [Phytophthora fragariae]